MQARLKRLFIIGVVSLLAIGFNMVVSNGSKKFAEGSGEGQKLFEANCLSCHSIGGGKGVGPDLKGVATIRDKEWLTKMIQDPKALVDSGDQAAAKLVDEYGMVMPKINVNDTEVAAIVSYLENQSAEASNNGGAAQDGQTQLTTSTFAIYGFLGALLLFAIMAFVWRGRLRGVRKNL